MLTFRPRFLRGAPLTHLVGRCSCFSCGTGRTLRLSRRRHGVILRYVRGVQARLRRPVSGRDGSLVASGVGLLLSCYVHFCSQRFVAHRGMGRSVLAHFRDLLSSCFTSGTPTRDNVPSMRCYTSGLYLSTGCLKSLLEGRAKVSTLGRVRRGALSVTQRQVSSASGSVNRVSCRLKFPCPRRFDH